MGLIINKIKLEQSLKIIAWLARFLRSCVVKFANILQLIYKCIPQIINCKRIIVIFEMY
jgi:hypothetical protein